MEQCLQFQPVIYNRTIFAFITLNVVKSIFSNSKFFFFLNVLNFLYYQLRDYRTSNKTIFKIKINSVISKKPAAPVINTILFFTFLNL